MPDIVAHGRKPEVYACGYCHRAVGTGGPENANITGLPAAYIIQQLADFKSGARRSALPHRLPVEVKALLAKKVTDADVAAAAAYFSSIPARSVVRVVEADTVPKTFVTGWHLAALTGNEKEQIGQRIIEIPENLEQFRSRDSQAHFIAYVPVGSIQKGRGLATTGGKGKTVQCALCHGADLKGAGPVPGIAGRSAVYIVRQLYDFQHGTRAGPSSALMKPTVEKLTLDDMIALAGYASSLAP